jgi:hypothetical protein
MTRITAITNIGSKVYKVIIFAGKGLTAEAGEVQRMESFNVEAAV